MWVFQNKKTDRSGGTDWIQISFFIVLMIAVIGLSVRILLPYASALFFGLIASIVFRPLYEYLLKRTERKNIAAFLATVVVLLVIVLPLVIFGILLFNEAYNFYHTNNFSASQVSWVHDVNNQVNRVLGNFSPEISLDISTFMDRVVGWFVNNLTTVFSKFIDAIIGLFIALFALFYLFRDGESMLKKIMFLSPLRDRYDEEIFQKVELAVNSVVRGSLVVALIQGFLSGIGFLIFGLPNPILWASISMVASLVPTVGTAVVLVPSVLYLYFSGSVGSAVGLLIWGSVAVGFVDNLVGTQLIGRGVKVHPFLILLSVIGGISFFGLIGFMVGPVILSLLFVLLEIFPLILGQSQEKPHRE